MIYINRGLFVAMPGIEISFATPAASNEINSVLEVILNWAGGHNELDEDGDMPETYNAASTIHPLIDHHFNDIFSERPYVSMYKLFYITDENIYSSGFYGIIDQPPKQFIIEYC
jgi:hypothetical protein